MDKAGIVCHRNHESLLPAGVVRQVHACIFMLWHALVVVAAAAWCCATGTWPLTLLAALQEDGLNCVAEELACQVGLLQLEPMQHVCNKATGFTNNVLP